MNGRVDRAELISKLKTLAGLTDEERSRLIGLLREHKKYGLVWEDKPEDAERLLEEQLPVLREVAEKRIPALPSPNEAFPNHILIEGDNLHALTALSYTHAGKIDVIYIDPPYNTGNKDFVYNDTYIDAEDGYRHSKWLSFMNKRLKIAKKLLSDKGVIFISIDDNEQAQLKLLCDEIFRNFDFVGTIPWRKRTAKADVPHSFSQDYEWIVCYAAQKFRAGIEKETRKYFETPDFPNRPWRIHDLTKQTSAVERPNSFFTIINPKTGDEYPANPNRTWAITKETFEKYYAVNRIVFPKDYDFLSISKPALRYWKEDDEKKAGGLFGFTTVSSDLPKEVGMTQDGTKDIYEVFGNKIFGFPKPLSLIRYFLKVSTPRAKKITILDFFAGSGTTLHATMQLNAEDGGHRKCILVTNNENNICEEVTYERNKRVIEGYTTPKGVAVAGLKENNLRYYKTDFIPRDRTVKNMRRLVEAATDMLCIKENIYQEQKAFATLPYNNNVYRYYEENGHNMLIIYQEEFIPVIVEAIKAVPREKWEKTLKVYVFSPDRDPYADEFFEVEDRVELCALPAAIYDAYTQVLPRWKDKAIEVNEEQVATEEDEWEV